MAKKVLNKLKKGSGKKRPKLSVTEYGKEGKSKMIALWFLGNELRQCSREGVTMQGVVKKLDMQESDSVIDATGKSRLDPSTMP